MIALSVVYVKALISIVCSFCALCLLIEPTWAINKDREIENAMKKNVNTVFVIAQILLAVILLIVAWTILFQIQNF